MLPSPWSRWMTTAATTPMTSDGDDGEGDQEAPHDGGSGYPGCVRVPRGTVVVSPAEFVARSVACQVPGGAVEPDRAARRLLPEVEGLRRVDAGRVDEVDREREPRRAGIVGLPGERRAAESVAATSAGGAVSQRDDDRRERDGRLLAGVARAETCTG